MWYYAQEGAPNGPLDATDLKEAVRTGAIEAETLVWREGFEAWQPLGGVDELRDFFASPVDAGGEPLGAGLRLGARGASFKRINTDAGGAHAAVQDSPLTVRDMIGGRGFEASTAWEGASAPADAPSGFRTKPFEFKFFVLTFALAALVTGMMAVMNPIIAFLPFAVQGTLGLAVGSLIFRIRTFQAHVGWGIGGMLVGFTDLLFVARHWDRAKPSVFLTLASSLVLAAALFGPWASLPAGSF